MARAAERLHLVFRFRDPVYLAHEHARQLYLAHQHARQWMLSPTYRALHVFRQTVTRPPQARKAICF
ncbi:unnamed protein product [Amoebophrya sp. A120]|nr:unnamed protein product [Amoebophrya sp. A120]|eukprot:GSA120T00015365001.1